MKGVIVEVTKPSQFHCDSQITTFKKLTTKITPKKLKLYFAMIPTTLLSSSRKRRLTLTLIALLVCLFSFSNFFTFTNPYGGLGSMMDVFPSSTEKEEEEEDLMDLMKRNTQGRAAVIIIRVEPDDATGSDASSTGNSSPGEQHEQTQRSQQETRYLIQRKSSDYPIPQFKNALCLYGGNFLSLKEGDLTPLDTLLRELKEELSEETFVMESILPKIQFRQYSYNFQSHKIFEYQQQEQQGDMAEKAKTEYGFLCVLFEAVIQYKDLPPSIFQVEEGNEGNYELLTKEELLRERYAWGYDYIMSQYFRDEGGDSIQKCNGVQVTPLSPHQMMELQKEYPAYDSWIHWNPYIQYGTNTMITNNNDNNFDNDVLEQQTFQHGRSPFPSATEGEDKTHVVDGFYYDT